MKDQQLSGQTTSGRLAAEQGGKKLLPLGFQPRLLGQLAAQDRPLPIARRHGRPGFFAGAASDKHGRDAPPAEHGRPAQPVDQRAEAGIDRFAQASQRDGKLPLILLQVVELLAEQLQEVLQRLIGQSGGRRAERATARPSGPRART